MYYIVPMGHHDEFHAASSDPGIAVATLVEMASRPGYSGPWTLLEDKDPVDYHTMIHLLEQERYTVVQYELQCETVVVSSLERVGRFVSDGDEVAYEGISR